MQVTKNFGALALFVSAAAAVSPRVVQIDKRAGTYGREGGGQTPPNSPSVKEVGSEF